MERIGGLTATVLELSFLAVIVCLGVLVIRDVRRGFGELLRRFRRSPQFGIGVLFSLVTISAVACALFRWLFKVPSVPATLIALLLATVIVLVIQFVLTDLRDIWAGRKRFQESRIPDSLAFNDSAPVESTAERESSGSASVPSPDTRVLNP